MLTAIQGQKDTLRTTWVRLSNSSVVEESMGMLKITSDDMTMWEEEHKKEHDTVWWRHAHTETATLWWQL